MSWSPGPAGPGSRTGSANSQGRVPGVISSGAIGSKTAARPGWTGRAAPHAAKMPQPWTVTSMASVTATMLAVSSRSPMATRRPAGPAAAQVPSSLAAWPRSRATGSRPGPS
jgi:hypothetical protein